MLTRSIWCCYCHCIIVAAIVVVAVVVVVVVVTLSFVLFVHLKCKGTYTYLAKIPNNKVLAPLKSLESLDSYPSCLTLPHLGV